MTRRSFLGLVGCGGCAAALLAFGLLRKRGCIAVDENGYISLTEEGSRTAKKILERHRVLTSFLEKIGVSPDVADDDACKIEHVISDEAFERIKTYIQED